MNVESWASSVHGLLELEGALGDSYSKPLVLRRSTEPQREQVACLGLAGAGVQTRTHLSLLPISLSPALGGAPLKLAHQAVSACRLWQRT